MCKTVFVLEVKKSDNGSYEQTILSYVEGVYMELDTATSAGKAALISVAKHFIEENMRDDDDEELTAQGVLDVLAKSIKDDMFESNRADIWFSISEKPLI